MNNNLIVVRGGGDLATGVIHCLWAAGAAMAYFYMLVINVLLLQSYGKRLIPKNDF